MFRDKRFKKKHPKNVSVIKWDEFYLYFSLWQPLSLYLSCMDRVYLCLSLSSKFAISFHHSINVWHLYTSTYEYKYAYVCVIRKTGSGEIFVVLSEILCWIREQNFHQRMHFFKGNYHKMVQKESLLPFDWLLSRQFNELQTNIK